MACEKDVLRIFVNHGVVVTVFRWKVYSDERKVGAVRGCVLCVTVLRTGYHHDATGCVCPVLDVNTASDGIRAQRAHASMQHAKPVACA